MKRPCEDSTSDSDMDETIDVGSENNYSGHSNGSFIRCGSPTTTTQVMARKKRRGIIEKRRRDRINNSLSELRRLVPTAFEKQVTAGYITLLGIHIFTVTLFVSLGYFDAHSLAMDFMSVGFRECLTEVARYLSSVEGLDSIDPLRVRLVSHLSTCVSQREAVAMTSSMAHHQQVLPPHHWAAAFHPLPAAFLQQSGLPSSDSAASRLSVEVPQRGSALLTATFAHTDSSHRAPSNGSVAPCVPPLSTSLLSLSATVHAAAAAAAAQTFPLSFPGGFPIFTPHSVSSTASMVASAVSPSISTTSTSQQSRDREGSSKPYRPWGTEVGAF
uniref:Hes-related family bHLH transcription factor with YRPW motif 2 n=1 Tax=Hucho hucho TaxID=62062 RepID=A0A4W5KGD2_9TELE